MVGNAFLASTVIMLALAFYLMQECEFLIPYRQLLFYKYGEAIGLFTLALFVNVFAAVYAASRKLFLKDTGRKLAHLEKQLRSDESISEELSRRLKE
jgi:hypothetical protein